MKYREKLNSILTSLDIDSIDKAELFGGLQIEFRRDILADIARYRGLISSVRRFLEADEKRTRALEAMKIDFSEGIPSE